MRLLRIACVLALPLLAGCSALNVQTHLNVEGTAEGTTVERDVSVGEDGVTWRDVTDGQDDISLSNHEGYHLIRWQAEGHFPEVVPLLPERRNPLKFLDVGTLVGGAALMGRGIANESNGTGPSDPAWQIGGGFFTAFFGGLGLIVPPKKVFDNTLQAPELLPMPSRQKDEPEVSVHAVDLALDTGDYKWRNYRDLKAFDARRAYYSSQLDEAFLLEDSNLDDEVQRVFEQTQWMPEDGDQADNAVAIHGRLTEVVEHRVGALMRYQLESDWAVHNPYGIATDTLHITSWSTWSGYVVGAGMRRDLVSEGLSFAAVQALGTEEATWPWRAKADEDLETEWKSTWDTLAVRPAAEAGKVSKALPSVVTVKGERGFGSGCIVDEAGYIVTNHHVVDDSSDVWTVRFHDERELPAELVRWDPVRDLALLKVDTLGLQPLAWCTEAPSVGDEVYAIGTPFEESYDATVTRGILSAKRGSDSYQTDVAISPGNSGGPLLNDKGELVGVVNAKVVAKGVEGIGFAIPLHELLPGLWLSR